jgi:glycosyltransferase involved in cell wall biosynthesis
MLRVLFVHRDLSPSGGVPHCILNFTRYGNPDDARVHVASLHAPSQLMASRLIESGASLHHLGDSGYARPAMRMRSILQREQIDVIVCCSFKSYVVAKLASLGLSCRIVLWIHAIPLVITGAIRRATIRRLSLNDSIVFVSQACRAAHEPAGHRGLSTVVYNGVPDWKLDPERHQPYDRARRKEFGIADNAFVLCYTAEMIGWKDHQTLLAAFERAAAQRPDLHLLLVGSGELIDSLKLAARQQPRSQQIHFLGTRPDARRILGLADLYIQPSQGEAFGLAVVEAMLAQRPVLAARCGGMVEYIRDGENGVLFQPGDAYDLAGKIITLAADPNRLQRMGDAARQTALWRFDPRRYAARLLSVLQTEGPATDQPNPYFAKIRHARA